MDKETVYQEGVKCFKCQGLLVIEDIVEFDSHELSMMARCINCGGLFDEIIVRNNYVYQQLSKKI